MGQDALGTSRRDFYLFNSQVNAYALYVANNTNFVGVGNNTSAAFPLDVNGGAGVGGRFYGTGTPFSLMIQNNGSGGSPTAAGAAIDFRGYVATNSVTARIRSGDGTGANYGGSLLFYTKSANNSDTDSLAERLRIIETGTIGINTTTPSTSYILDVNGASRFTGVLNANVGLNVGTSSSFDSNGNLGVRMQPAYPLDVMGVARFSNVVWFNQQVNQQMLCLWADSPFTPSNNATNYYGLGLSIGVLRYQCPSPTTFHTWYANASSIMTLTGTGNLAVSNFLSVGSGSTAPSYSLAVTGTVGISGANFLQFGTGVAGQEGNAGKLGYQTITTGALDIIGAGTASGSRGIKLWDNVLVNNTLTVTNGVSGGSGSFSGLLYGGTLQTSVFTISGQGHYVGWNRDGSSGRAGYACQPGQGSGGFEWVQYNSSNTLTSIPMTLTGGGNLGITGTMTTGGTSYVSGTGFSNVVIATSGFAYVSNTSACMQSLLPPEWLSLQQGGGLVAAVYSIPAVGTTLGTPGVLPFPPAGSTYAGSQLVGPINTASGVTYLGLSTQFAVCFTGFVLMPAAETVTFQVTVDDGAMLWVADQQLVGTSAWKVQASTTYSGTYTNATANALVPIRLQYFQNTASSALVLSWAGTSTTGGASTFQPIPAANLYAPSASAASSNISSLNANVGNPITFNIGGTEDARFDLNGNLGLNTKTPAFLLDVNGTSRFQNTVNANTSVNIGGAGGTYGAVFDSRGNLTSSGTLSLSYNNNSSNTSSLSAITYNTGDPGPMVQSYYNTPGNRYGVGQYMNGQLKIYTAGSHPPAGVSLSFAGNTGAFVDAIKCTQTGSYGTPITQISGPLGVNKAPTSVLDVAGNVRASGNIVCDQYVQPYGLNVGNASALSLANNQVVYQGTVSLSAGANSYVLYGNTIGFPSPFYYSGKLSAYIADIGNGLATASADAQGFYKSDMSIRGIITNATNYQYNQGSSPSNAGFSIAPQGNANTSIPVTNGGFAQFNITTLTSATTLKWTFVNLMYPVNGSTF